jgi:hypothetical protein
MTSNLRPFSGWEHSDCAPLTKSPDFISLDEPIADNSIPTNPELCRQLREIYEALGQLGEVPGACDCGHRFKGDLSEFKVTIIFNKGDGAETPEIKTLCKECCIDCGLPAPNPEDDHQTKVVLFMRDQGSTQVEIAKALNMSQSTVSRIITRDRKPTPIQ